jgi:hypothetical protein
MVRHSVGASPYTDTRIGEFIGKKIINDNRALTGAAPLNYLAELSVEELNSEFAKLLPATIVGSDFLKQHRTHGDPVTTIQPDAEYRVAGPTRHPVEENERVLKFIDALRSANDANEKALVTAGEMMYGAHDSYKNNCNLSAEEVDFLVDAVRSAGRLRASMERKLLAAAPAERSRFLVSSMRSAIKFRRLRRSFRDESASCRTCLREPRQARWNSGRGGIPSVRTAGAERKVEHFSTIDNAEH